MDVGTQIEKYRIIEHIGRGGMADVWSARDETLGRMVAIKTIARNLSSESDPVTMFEREAKTIAQLDHPNILPIFSFGKFEGKLYIAMRFVAGGSLEDKLALGALSYRESTEIGRAIASALAFAHSENIIHLDLKPPNILLDSRGAPYLADFGLATVLGPEGRAENPGSGTLLYMAPEQLTSDQLDLRVDVYSFSLVIFHMLTGRLPFEGITPLALKQIQFHEDLPHLGDLNPDLPGELTDILRKGTAVNPDDRYDDVAQLMKDVEQALGMSMAVPMGAVVGTGGEAGMSTPFVDLVTEIDPRQVQLREAIDIYERARRAWANGNGRFLLSVTHFMVMSDYYVASERHDLQYDKPGAQMLLRGALEYDYHLEHWWSKVNNDSRRWVCLHTIRSENPQARIRAFQRLLTLPDSDPPQIPKQTAQALTIENDELVSLAAIEVLADRARLIEGRDDFDVNTQFRGQILGTIARDGLQLIASDRWQNVTYSQEIDTLVAEFALDGRTPNIRATAASAVGRMRSARAVRHIVDERKRDSRRALNALAYILEEVPTLPKNVEFVPRFLAWLINTGRRLSHHPMQIVWAFTFALMGGWLGMGQHIYRTYRAQSFFASQRILNTTAGGLFIGLLFGVLTIAAFTLPKRLEGFWPNWTRAIWSITASYFLAQTIWWAYGWMYLNLNDIPSSIVIATGIGTSLGVVIPALFRMRGWAAALLMTATLFVPLYVGTTNMIRTYVTFQPPLFGISPEYAQFGWVLAYDNPLQIWTVMLPMIVLVALGVHFPALLQDVRDLLSLFRHDREAESANREKRGLNLDTVSLDRDMVANNNPSVEHAAVTSGPRTEEFDVDRIGKTGPAWQDAAGSDGPRTEEFDTDKVGGGVGSIDKFINTTRPDRDALLGDSGPRTEEFATDKVGGKQPDPNEMLNTTRPDRDALLGDSGPRTEEFATDKVGGKQPDEYDLSSDPNLETVRDLKDAVDMPTDEEFPAANDTDAPNWDAIMSPLDVHTEEFEVGQVGGKTAHADEDDPWDAITRQLDDLADDDKDHQ
jgi:hypothetical protein